MKAEKKILKFLSFYILNFSKVAQETKSIQKSRLCNEVSGRELIGLNW